MNKKEKQEIEDLRKHFYTLIDELPYDNILLAAHFSSITGHLWRLAHKRNWHEKLIYKLKSKFKRRKT